VDNFLTPESTELSAVIKKYSPFIAEIRKRIIYTFAAFAIAAISGFLFYEKIIKFLIDILSLNGVNVVFTSPFQFINLSISCGLAAGLIIVFPLIIFQILSFLRPALKKKEFNIVASFIPFSIGLFLIGFSFGILIMRWQIQIFLSQASSLEIGNILDISRILSTVLLTSVLMGLGCVLHRHGSRSGDPDGGGIFEKLGAELHRKQRVGWIHPWARDARRTRQALEPHEASLGTGRSSRFEIFGRLRMARTGRTL
jgi:hypothetical protein